MSNTNRAKTIGRLLSCQIPHFSPGACGGSVELLRLGFESAAKMKRLALALLAVIVTLSLVVVVRALRFSSRQIAVSPAVAMHLESAALLGRLSRAIQFRTLSSSNPERAGNEEFERFRDFLDESFSLPGAQLKKEIIGGLSLLYSWPGQDSALKPILLMAHMDVVAAADELSGFWPRRRSGRSPRRGADCRTAARPRREAGVRS
jgi:hypothetical protein